MTADREVMDDLRERTAMRTDNVWIVSTRTRLVTGMGGRLFSARCLGGGQPEFCEQVFGHGKGESARCLELMLRDETPRRVEAVLFEHPADAPEPLLRAHKIKLLVRAAQTQRRVGGGDSGGLPDM